jgi:hypothetical protein
MTSSPIYPKSAASMNSTPIPSVTPRTKSAACRSPRSMDWEKLITIATGAGETSERVSGS